MKTNPNIPLSMYQNLPQPLQTEVITAANVNNIEEIKSNSNLHTLSELITLNQSKNILGVVRALIVSMGVNLHVDNGLTNANVNNLADGIVNNPVLQTTLTLADVDLLCRRIVAGDFGVFSSHFSEGEFNQCLKMYLEERSGYTRTRSGKSIRKDAVRLRLETAAVVKEWRQVLYDAGWPCAEGLSPGRRLELSQTARRLNLIEAAAAVLDKAIR